MKNIIILFALISIQFLNAQSRSKLKAELTNFNNTELPFNSLGSFNVEIELERKIDFGYVQHRLSVNHTNFKLNYISKNGIVEIGWLSEKKSYNRKNINVSFFKNKPESLKNYIDNHNALYNTDLNEKDFRKQIMAEYTVGYRCSEDLDFTPKKSKKALRFTKNKNTKALHKYLTSFSSELQTLGAIGLLKINKLTKKQKEIIEHLKSRNSKVITCSGCLFGVESNFVDEI